jgi:dipeptidyl aminopeptidase/acylaminoacyl peptidase
MIGAATDHAAWRSEHDEQRQVNVADMIEMNRLEPPTIEGTHLSELAVQFSPDHSMFVAVVSRGNLKTNTVDYSLLLYATSRALQSPPPVRLLTFSSSSNRPGIQAVEWCDNQTLSFLGENTSQLQQLYTLDVVTGRLEQVTDHPTSVVSYAISKNRDNIFFVAEMPERPLFGPEVERRGLAVTTQDVVSLVLGSTEGNRSYTGRLFAMDRHKGRSEAIDVPGTINTLIPGSLHLSPDARYLVLKVTPKTTPPEWKEYQSVGPEQFVVIDIATGTIEPLMNAPVSWSTELVWAPDSASLVVTNTYLPLVDASPNARKERQSTTFVTEIKIPSREVIPITPKDLMLLYWDSKTNRVIFDASGRLNIGFGIASGHTVAFQRRAKGWEEVGDSEIGDVVIDSPQVILKQDMNIAPRLTASDKSSGRESTLLDLNPQFRNLGFGVVREITWKSRDGRDIRGGLYLPPNYVQGARYPLIIQTHGWDADEFWIGGPFSTAFAAQPMASKGFVVLQVGIGGGRNAQEDYKSLGTPEEMPREVASYEGAIDYLDHAGLIFRDKIGIIGFSRTCLHVKYALAHSKYDFAAAIVADGFDGGYFQYILWGDSEDYGIYGTAPFGKGLDVWLKDSPSFSLDKVHAPLWVQAIGPSSVLGQWEWFAGLSKLGRPVDMIYFPNGVHELVKPWERLASQQGTVDWFCFWLKNEEDPIPAKAEQYARWRALRELQQENEAKQKTATPAN